MPVTVGADGCTGKCLASLPDPCEATAQKPVQTYTVLVQLHLPQLRQSWFLLCRESNYFGTVWLEEKVP